MEKYMIMELARDRHLVPVDYAGYSIKRDHYDNEFFDSQVEARDFIDRYLAGYRKIFVVLPILDYR